MPDVYTQSEMISNGIFMFLAGISILYLIGHALQRKHKK